MANLIEKAKIFQQELDKQMLAGATSGWMEDNAGQVKYNGGSEVKIPKISMDGLGDYDREEGFAQGSVTLSFETKTLTQDRSRSFMLDSMDVNESNFIANASKVIGEFQRTKVIPEVDAYRYSSITAQAIAKAKATGGYTAAAASILTKIQDDINAIQDVTGEIQLMIILSGAIAGLLDSSSEIQKKLSVIDFARGELKLKVKGIDIHPIIRVPSARMKSAYVFNNGKTAGQEAGGFTPAVGAKNVNWIIIPRTEPIAVSKTDTLRIFDPATNQKADAWKIDYRKYHDLWIKDNAFDAIRVNIKEALA